VAGGPPPAVSHSEACLISSGMGNDAWGSSGSSAVGDEAVAIRAAAAKEAADAAVAKEATDEVVKKKAAEEAAVRKMVAEEVVAKRRSHLLDIPY
jgi:hypothetical protein